MICTDGAESTWQHRCEIIQFIALMGLNVWKKTRGWLASSFERSELASDCRSQTSPLHQEPQKGWQQHPVVFPLNHGHYWAGWPFFYCQLYHTYYLFIISLGKFSGSCNVVLPKIFVPKETKIKTLKHLIYCQIKVRLKQWQHIFHVIVNANSAMQYLIKSIME